MPNAAPDTALLAAVFDAYPAPTLLMDLDVRVLHMNGAAAELLSREAGGPVLLRRAGDALHCTNAVGESGGCTKAAACRECGLRGAVLEAVAAGALRRRRAFLRLRTDAGISEAHFLVSAAPLLHAGQRLVIVTLDDLTEVTRLRSLIPVCSHCRRVRTEQNGWERLETYLKARLDVDFSHCICESCLERYLPEDAGKAKPIAG